jgi:hypothetical protein
MRSWFLPEADFSHINTAHDMKPHELYKAAGLPLIAQMLDWFRTHDKNVYKHAIATLANSRKLRPLYVTKKSNAEQYQWIYQTLQLRASDTLGENLLQAWFMAGHQPMLGSFCDALAIPHDGKGSITGDLPATIEDAAMDAGIAKLLETYDPSLVALYLHVFNMQQEGGWPNLSDRLANHEALRMQATA